MGITLQNPFILQKHLPVHGNLIRYYDSDVFNTEGIIQGVIITEHCGGGVLSDVVTQTYPQSLSEKMILGILRDLLCALFALHTSNPPTSHRNINVFFYLLWIMPQPHYIYIHSSGRCKLEAARSMTSNIIVFL